MGFKLWCAAALILAYVINFLSDFGYFEVIYNHHPGKCTKFKMNGAEDFVLYPNNHVLISSGIFFPHNEEEGEKVPPGIFLLDLNSEYPEPINITLRGFQDSKIPSELNPHGMGHWVTKDGAMILYFINHRKSGDTVESFRYDPSKKSLVHRRTFRSKQFFNLNDLVLVGLDQFYVTVDHYFSNKAMFQLETYLRVPMAYVLYHDGEESFVASEGLKYPNGIAKSNDGRFIFVNELLRGQVIAYSLNPDHTLKRIQMLQLQIANDNIFVDPKTGHLWVGIIAQPLEMKHYFYNRSHPVGSRILHISIDPQADLPFDKYFVEEVFSSTGEGENIAAVTGCVYSQGKLVVGSVRTSMLLCDAPYYIHQ